MGINRFYLNIFVRVILIVITCLGLVIFITQFHRPATTLLIVLLLMGQTASLIHYVNRTNRELARFLIYMKEKDTSLAFSNQHMEKTFKGLRLSFKEIIDEIQLARIGKEQQHQYLSMLVEHLNTGLISFDESGKVEMANRAACAMLNLPAITHIDQLDSLKAGLSNAIRNLKPKEQCLVKLGLQHQVQDLLIRSSNFKLGNKKITLVSFQDIRHELDKKEIDSWQKLIRILRHEIMNSITPITTLTVAIQRRLKYEGKLRPFNEINEESLADVLQSAEVIEERSKGLLNFVDTYKSLTKLPQPVFEIIAVDQLFQQVALLMREGIVSKQLELQLLVQPPDLSVNIDKKLFEQVLINLVKNAMEACEKHGIIRMEAQSRKDHTEILMINNGNPIPEEDLENIFIPFFTTRKEGSGIGLSLSRQIVQIHGGTLTAWSKPGENTVFTIELPQ